MTLDISAVVKEYIWKMLSDCSGGMKAFILDDFTINIVSVVFSQTELLQAEVFLVERLQHIPVKKLQHFKAVCFVRPTMKNCEKLCEHLKRHIYGEYFLFFSHLVQENLLQKIAASDEYEVVRQVQELYASFVPVDPSLFSLEFSFGMNYSPSDKSLRADRVVEGISSLLLSLKWKPAIRFQRSSSRCRHIAEEIHRLAYIQEPGLFDFRQKVGDYQLIVLDRMEDPVTPLLSQWTYQAMVHEILGIKNNKVQLRHSLNDEKEIVLASSHDSFYQENMFSNYGDLGLAVKQLVDNFQAISKINKQIESIDDMHRFIESFPEFRHQSGSVAKHVNLISELSKIINEKSLMTVSRAEQEVVCGSDRVLAFDLVMDLLADNKILPFECLKLALLFILRYGGHGNKQVDEVMTALTLRNLDKLSLNLVKNFGKIVGSTINTECLFWNRNFFSRASKLVGDLKGAENVFTQHQPLLLQILDNILKGRLKEADYPHVGEVFPKDGKSHHVILFIVGGVTYEEARFVANANQSRQGLKVILGGTTITNSQAFVQDLRSIANTEQSAT